jgi:hypothetical protein
MRAGKEHMERLSLDELTGGALQEKFGRAMETVVRNMQDPNTPWKVKRAITIRLTFQQNEDRDDATVCVSVDTKTAPVKPIETRMSIGTDLGTGDVYAQEYGSQVRGQMAFSSSLADPSELLIDGKPVDPETGEIKETENVLDFRAAKKA